MSTKAVSPYLNGVRRPLGEVVARREGWPLIWLGHVRHEDGATVTIEIYAPDLEAAQARGYLTAVSKGGVLLRVDRDWIGVLVHPDRPITRAEFEGWCKVRYG